MGAQLSHYYQQAKQYLSSKTPAERAYITLASSLIVAQVAYLSLNFWKLGTVLRAGHRRYTNFGLKPLLFLVPAISALFLKRSLEPRSDSEVGYFQMIKNSSSKIKLASLSAFSLLMGYVTYAQVKILKGAMNRISPAVVYSLLGVSIGLPLGEKLYSKYKHHLKLPSKAKCPLQRAIAQEKCN
mmetsp:Transcript_12855/g.14763  ORF Transcript_12855/g.14763 Transcript_12855/m.14763 type:complete len:184 (-) Transcript_12855:99-650(-)